MNVDPQGNNDEWCHEWDLYIQCSNEDGTHKSKLYDCIDYVVNDTLDIYDGGEWAGSNFKSCASAFGTDKPSKHGMWEYVVVALPLAVPCAVILLVLARVVKDHTGMKDSQVNHRRVTDSYIGVSRLMVVQVCGY